MNGCSYPALPIGCGTGGIGTDAITYPAVRPSRQLASVFVLLTLFAVQSSANCPQNAPESNAPLKQLSLAQLGNVEVTTTSKEPESVWRTPAAIYVITQEDIRRSGDT